jgi:hypothetical protein
MKSTPREQEGTRVVMLLDEVEEGKKPDAREFNRGYDKRVYCNARFKLNDATRQLCTYCKLIESAGTMQRYSLQLQSWWRDHKRADARRLAKERKAKAKADAERKAKVIQGRYKTDIETFGLNMYANLLGKHKERGYWRENEQLTTKELVRLLRAKTKLMHYDFRNRDISDKEVAEYAVDVANYAMMTWHHMTHKKETS